MRRVLGCLTLLLLRRALLSVVSTASLLGLAWGCASSNDVGTAGPPGGQGGLRAIEAGSDARVFDGSADAGDKTPSLNPLCGVGCVPDQPKACQFYVPPASTLDAAGVATPAADASVSPPDAARVNVDAAPPVQSLDAASPAQAGAGGEGGAPSQAVTGAAGAAGAAGAGGMSGASGAGGTVNAAGGSGEAGAAGGSSSPSQPALRFSCQIQRSASTLSAVSSACGVVGTGQIGDPCFTASDCSGALGCVGDANTGLCEPYCCAGNDSCKAGTYCAERPLRDALINNSVATGSAVSAIMIPVCVPAVNCDLSTPYPCPSGTQCACASNTACLVVRADGTTTCAMPGTGKAGEACPCAWGHVCSEASNECLELCNTRGENSCGDGICQASAELPMGWGVCIGASLLTGD